MDNPKYIQLGFFDTPGDSSEYIQYISSWVFLIYSDTPGDSSEYIQNISSWFFLIYFDTPGDSSELGGAKKDIKRVRFQGVAISIARVRVSPHNVNW